MLILFYFILSACGETAGPAPKTAAQETFTFGGSLYVANGGDGRLLAFDPLSSNSKTAQSKIVPRVPDGNVFPDRQFPNAITGPTGVFLDRSNDTLYVANTAQNAIQIYENASTLTGSPQPTRVISGSKTLMDEPYAVAFDGVTERLFVANRGGNTITAFHSSCISAAPLDGDILPCTLLVGDQTQLDFPRALAIDPSKNLLYISNAGSDSILVYDNANALGASPASCINDFTSCNIPPTRIISPHEDLDKSVSKLELPFGIALDRVNDRLYVVNTGLNQPAVLIYEDASTLNGGVVPERVITGLNSGLTVPAGIAVDETRGRVIVVNNNSPNNVNSSTGNNVDSPSVVVFNEIDMVCPLLASPSSCELSPDSRIGGDVSPETGTTLSSPVGLAFDPTRDTAYIANTGANNIFIYVVEENTAPLKENFGAATTTLLNVPSGVFYDLALDRLYISNAGNGMTPSLYPITVYNHVSDESFNVSKAPDWTIGGSSFNMPRGVYIDKTRNLMLVADGSSVGSPAKYGLIAYNLNTSFSNGVTPVPFPINNADGPSGSETSKVDLQAPGALNRGTDGLSPGGPTAMTVDEARGEVYVADKNNNSVVVFKLPPPAGPWLKEREITGLKKPYGVFIDTQRDILYVTNNGVETGVSSDNTVYVYENASTKGDGGTACFAAPCLPDRIISTEGFADPQKKLKAPISPYVDLATNRLFLIKSASHVEGSVTYPEAVLTFQEASTLGDATSACLDRTGVCADVDLTKVKKLSGDKTRLAFWQDAGTTPLRRYTGAVFLSKHKNNDTLYVAQSAQKNCVSGCSGGALLVYGIEGRVPPSKIWSDGSGGFVSPEALALDPIKNVLYVANQGSNTLSILEKADKVDVTLDATTGKRDLNNLQLNRPAGLVIDSALDRLYVSNSESISCGTLPCNAVLVFNDASTLLDGQTPSETISDPDLISPRGLAVDGLRKRLYIASHGNNAVLVFSVEGAAARSLFLSGVQSGLDEPAGLALDSVRDILYVLNQGKTEVLVFENASSLSGNASPSRVITGRDGNGNNFMVKLSGIFVDAGKDILYVADRDANAVYIFPDASTATGQSPLKTLAGDKTGLQSPVAITVNTSSP